MVLRLGHAIAVETRALAPLLKRPKRFCFVSLTCREGGAGAPGPNHRLRVIGIKRVMLQGWRQFGPIRKRADTVPHTL